MKTLIPLSERALALKQAIDRLEVGADTRMDYCNRLAEVLFFNSYRDRHADWLRIVETRIHNWQSNFSNAGFERESLSDLRLVIYNQLRDSKSLLKSEIMDFVFKSKGLEDEESELIPHRFVERNSPNPSVISKLQYNALGNPTPVEVNKTPIVRPPKAEDLLPSHHSVSEGDPRLLFGPGTPLQYYTKEIRKAEDNFHMLLFRMFPFYGAYIDHEHVDNNLACRYNEVLINEVIDPLTGTMEQTISRVMGDDSWLMWDLELTPTGIMVGGSEDFRIWDWKRINGFK